jgi:hypothetical protein
LQNYRLNQVQEQAWEEVRLLVAELRARFAPLAEQALAGNSAYKPSVE